MYGDRIRYRYEEKGSLDNKQVSNDNYYFYWTDYVDEVVFDIIDCS